MLTPIVLVGDSITGGKGGGRLYHTPDEVYLRGFNTISGSNLSDLASAYDHTGEIIAAVCGRVETTDRVVSVKGRSPRYLPEVGDIVVGRVRDITGNKWLIEVNAAQAGILLLSNVAEPGGILRRRSRGDELSMRQLFDQDDLAVMEVQRISPDGVIFLHTRSAEKYGKLSTFGHLVSVPPHLIKRAKHQFFTLPRYSSQLIVGLNGNIWISHLATDTTAEAVQDFHEEGVDIHRNVARVTNCIKILGAAGIQISPKTIERIVENSTLAGLSAYDVLLPKNFELLTVNLNDMGVGLKRPRF